MTDSYQPYEPPRPEPGGSYGYGPPKKSVDPVSVIGLVFSLTCCLLFVGVILGFIGLDRTKPPNGLGARWAAVASLAVGIPFTLLFAGVIVFAVLDDSEYLEDLHTGDCFTATGFDDDGEAIADIQAVPCTGKHGAEVLRRVVRDPDHVSEDDVLLRVAYASDGSLTGPFGG